MRIAKPPFHDAACGDYENQAATGGIDEIKKIGANQ
jgi:hypothetical protein